MMSANEKKHATFYDPASGEQGYVPSVEFARGGYIYDRITLGVVDAEGAKTEFDRMIAKVRAEAKQEALNEAATKLEDTSVSPIWFWDKCGDPKCPDDIRVGAATEIQKWLRGRANQYKETR